LTSCVVFAGDVPAGLGLKGLPGKTIACKMQQLLDTWKKSDDDVMVVDDMPAHQLDAVSLSSHVRPEAGTSELRTKQTAEQIDAGTQTRSNSHTRIHTQCICYDIS
jgi:hypothetical protein